MKKHIFFVYVTILLIGLVSATSLNYEIFEDKALVEINFGSVNELEFKLPLDARLFESNIENYELIDFEDHKLLKVDKADNLDISYITNHVIDKTSKRNFFIFNNKIGEINLILSLPEGGILGDLIFPDPDNILTDGKRIILKWNNFTGEEIVVDYTVKKESNFFWVNVLLALLITFIIFYMYKSIKFKKQLRFLKTKSKSSKKKSKEKRKKNITRNLFGEEKKIIEYLMGRKRNESWTKELVRDVGISKVRLSRKLRNLEQKELIEKIPYGNENRIKLLKTR